MTAKTDMIKLYSQRILALAADIPNHTRLDTPGATVRRRAPLCGSAITIDLSCKNGVVTAFGQDVKACALGQAAASVVGGSIIGCNAAEVRAARDALARMLTEDGPTPSAPFDGLEVLRPAQEYKNRHASIMLSLDAAVEALDSACA